MKNTEEHDINKSYIHCPRCDKMLFQAVMVKDEIIKCDKCHRRYLINIQEGNISIQILNKSKEEE